MSSVGGIIVVLLVIIVFGYMVAKKKVNLRSLLSGGLPSTDKLKDATAKEIDASERLRSVLEAKKVLMRARAANAKLRKEIADLNETNVDARPQVLPTTKLRR